MSPSDPAIVLWPPLGHRRGIVCQNAGLATPPRATVSRSEPAGSEPEEQLPPNFCRLRDSERQRNGRVRILPASRRKKVEAERLLCCVRRRDAFRLPSSAAVGPRAGLTGCHGGGGPASEFPGAAGAAAAAAAWGARALGSRACSGTGAAQRHGRALWNRGLGYRGGLRRLQFRQADGPLRAAGKSVLAWPFLCPLSLCLSQCTPHCPAQMASGPALPEPSQPCPSPLIFSTLTVCLFDPPCSAPGPGPVTPQ